MTLRDRIIRVLDAWSNAGNSYTNLDWAHTPGGLYGFATDLAAALEKEDIREAEREYQPKSAADAIACAAMSFFSTPMGEP